MERARDFTRTVVGRYEPRWRPRERYPEHRWGTRQASEAGPCPAVEERWDSGRCIARREARLGFQRAFMEVSCGGWRSSWHCS